MASKIHTEIKGNSDSASRILTPKAVEFLTELHQNFQARRKTLMEMREKRQLELDLGHEPDFLMTTSWIREDKNWKVAPCPREVEKRHVEITGPTDKKMIINALNSGADVFMADFEDANSPTFSNMVEGQANVFEALKGELNFLSKEGKAYKLNENRAHLFVRPRGWHLNEKHFLVGAEEISASFFDFGLFIYHNGKNLEAKNSHPYLYLPKIESHLEARLWNDVFLFAEEKLKLPKGFIKTTVLIETILAAFEMDEILYELKTRCLGLNAGRWDYIFSAIKKFRAKSDLIFPDRKDITMEVPFMKAYAELLVKTCHQRGAHAMGGMSAFVPSRKDPKINQAAFKKVEEDKLREVKQGFDGTWVAHPDLVPLAKEIFKKALQEKEHQKEKIDVHLNVQAKDLLNFNIPNSSMTEEGVKLNISAALEYLTYWLMGIGAYTIHHLMEDAATAEIARAQIWQWLKRGSLSEKKVKELMASEKEALEKQFSDQPEKKKALKTAQEILTALIEKEPFIEFLTSYSYKYLP